MDEYLTSEYWEAFGVPLNKDAVAYVEGLDDEIFWESVFRKYAPSLRILFSPYSREGNVRHGKTAVLSEENRNNLGKSHILCVDSDYDYLIGDETLDSPFIFHTYSHSIENYKISPAGLESVVKKSCYVTDVPFSFEQFWIEYSKSAYNILLYILYFEHRKRLDIAQDSDIEEMQTEPLIENKQITKVLSLETAHIDETNHGKKCLDSIAEKCSQLLHLLSQKYPALTEEIIKKELPSERLDLLQTPSDTFWFLRGHTLYNSVAKLLIEKLGKVYRSKQKKWYEKKMTDHPDQPQWENQYREYKNKTRDMDWKTLLQDGHTTCLAYDACPTMRYIQSDIEDYMTAYH